jgi:signal transduction histidine kinase
VKILRKGLADEHQAAKALEIIEKSANLQNRLIEDVFDVARINSGKLNLDPRPMSLCESVTQAVELVRPAAKAKNITLEIPSDAETIFIMGDPDRIRQVITNILSNAVKFTPEGGHVRLGLQSSGSTARLVIEDNGPGISPELLPQIFEPYAQAKKDSRRGQAGLGLGLPLARRLVERHGGEITAESAGQNRGATFTISLPLIEV